MILNNALNIKFNNADITKLYCGEDIVWGNVISNDHVNIRGIVGYFDKNSVSNNSWENRYNFGNIFFYGVPVTVISYPQANGNYYYKTNRPLLDLTIDKTVKFNNDTYGYMEMGVNINNGATIYIIAKSDKVNSGSQYLISTKNNGGIELSINNSGICCKSLNSEVVATNITPTDYNIIAINYIYDNSLNSGNFKLYINGNYVNSGNYIPPNGDSIFYINSTNGNYSNFPIEYRFIGITNNAHTDEEISYYSNVLLEHYGIALNN